ncbi:GerAB/ArcD/ProY family transporter [Ammoniphilus resinae]|uniref:Spore germination protein n=1 Tax=Ammoniphilus resinae TaxID=861532 RepID=A0ABS4GVK5_9BACL|nr:GerAB/ArcD/ProY family transporter [Ammoniphilus resinae]MBP1934309.1 hypothetical protein [Ammoniphilus resinae]
MSRFYYYLIFLNMTVNVVAFVPNVLLQQRFIGAVPSMVIALIVGTINAAIFGFCINRFPGEGLPEILNRYVKPWIRTLFLLLMGVTWFIAGIITILIFVDVSKQYINPEMPEWTFLFIFLAFVVLCAKMPSIKVLYLLELLLILNLPLVAIIFLKVYTHPYFSWDAVKEVGTHALTIPAWDSFTVALYTFAGYLNMVIFARVMKDQFQFKRGWIIGSVAFVNLFTTFFIPIGLLGTEAVGHARYPWVMTADTIRFDLSPIERGIGLFLLLYVSISLTSALIHWHVGLELMKGAVNVKKYKAKAQRIIPWMVTLLFCGVTFAINELLFQSQIRSFSIVWYTIRLFGEFLLIFLLGYCAWRRGHEGV